LRKGSAAARGIHVHEERVGVALEDRFLTGREILAVLLIVLAGDSKPRLVFGKWIGVAIARLEPFGPVFARQAAGPLGERAVGVTGSGRAQRSEILAKAGDVFRCSGNDGIDNRVFGAGI